MNFILHTFIRELRKLIRYKLVGIRKRSGRKYFEGTEKVLDSIDIYLVFVIDTILRYIRAVGQFRDFFL